jgi:hypothetical protein
VQITTTLIVILMYSTIIGMGVAQLLGGLAGTLTQGRDLTTRRLPLTWVLLVLVRFLILFWTADLLTGRQNWHFLEFLAVLLGPILLLFASAILNVLISVGDDHDESQRTGMMSRFFWCVAASELWLVCADVYFGRGWSMLTSISGLTVVAAVAASIAVIRGTRRWPTWFTAGVAVLTAADIVTRSS